MFHNSENMPEILKLPIESSLISFALTLLAAYGIAWFYRNNYDPIRYIKAYLVYAIPFIVIGLWLELRIIIIAGIYIFGFIILIFRSQHYFDK